MKFSNKIKIILGFVLSLTFSCKKSGNAPSAALVDSLYQLAYGNSTSDRTQLANRISGNVPPKFAEVISKWKRFSGTTYYPTVLSIIASPSYCQTTLDGSGMWANSLSPVANPNTDGACNTASMNSLSWIYLTGPDRLFNIQNTNNYNGFFSSLKFDTFTAEATLSSTDLDDDAIGVAIAVYVDPANNDVHTLSAYRTQGGFPAPSLGWGVLYKLNGAVIRTFDNKSVGGVNKNGASGDQQGWNGRNTQIRIERTGNIVKAYTSVWNTGSTASAIDLTSLIQLDLSDTANGLTMFVGAQSYGYETISQARATFSNLTFITPLANADPEYLFDLKDNLVYTKKSSGVGYQLVTGLKALDMLGYPKIITNLETQGEFQINSSSSFTEL
jgi:hypothetical protein